MEKQFDKFLRVFRALQGHKVDYVLIGGMAVILYGLERLTNDIDLFVRPDKNNIDRLKTALRSLYNDSAIDEITVNELIKYPVIRYGAPDGFHIDLVVRLGTAFNYDDLHYTDLKLHDTNIRIATPETLYLLKKDTVRTHDKSDAFFLRELIERQKGRT